jgi:hypothetical protein
MTLKMFSQTHNGASAMRFVSYDKFFCSASELIAGAVAKISNKRKPNELVKDCHSCGVCVECQIDNPSTEEW